jgi:long-subunit fatty acid transport protein
MKQYFHPCCAFSLLKVTLIFLVFLLSPLKIKAQITNTLSSGRFSGMGKASVAVQGTEALFSNPANLWGIEKSTVLLATEWRFGVENLHPISVGLVSPTKSSVFGFAYQYMGIESVRNNTLSLAYARKLMSKLDVGIRLKYQRVKIPSYGSQNIIGFDMGFNTLIIKHLRLGFYVQNPLPFKINDNETTQTQFQLGAAYHININVLVSFETVKSLYHPATFRFGVEYKFDKNWVLRGGFESFPAAFSFGLGHILSSHFKMDLALSSQSVLGLTPSITMAYNY